MLKETNKVHSGQWTTGDQEETYFTAGQEGRKKFSNLLDDRIYKNMVKLAVTKINDCVV